MAAAASNQTKLTFFWKGAPVSQSGKLEVGAIELQSKGMTERISLFVPKKIAAEFVPLTFNIERQHQELVKQGDKFKVIPKEEMVESLTMTVNQLVNLRLTVGVLEEKPSNTLMIMGADGIAHREMRMMRTDTNVVIKLPGKIEEDREYQLFLTADDVLDFTAHLKMKGEMPQVSKSESAAAPATPVASTATAAAPATPQVSLQDVLTRLKRCKDQDEVKAVLGFLKEQSLEQLKVLQEQASKDKANDSVDCGAFVVTVSLLIAETTQGKLLRPQIEEIVTLMGTDLDAALTKAHALTSVPHRTKCLVLIVHKFLEKRTLADMVKAREICNELPEGTEKNILAGVIRRAAQIAIIQAAASFESQESAAAQK
jgi:hypothetical protein